MKIIPNLLCVIILMGCSICVAQDLSNAPKSADYPAPRAYKGKVAPVILDSARARLYRTALKEGVKQGPNFAGHHTLVTWGCGLGSFSMAVVDAKTGKIYFPPFRCIGRSEYGIPLIDKGYNPAFKIESKLLVFAGAPDEGGEYGMHFYVFNKARFKRVHFIKEKEE